MKQISTGAGLLGLGVCMVATAFIATHRGGSEAFAQVTGTERRIVAQGVYQAWGGQYDGPNCQWAYRVWSDNVTEVKFLGASAYTYDASGNIPILTRLGPASAPGAWQIVDGGTPTFMPTDIDRSGQVDAGDIAQVLMDFNTFNDPTTPPLIDCNINASR